MSPTSGRPLAAGEVLAVVVHHEVDYLLIGGVPMQARGHVRTTQDLDVIASCTIAVIDAQRPMNTRPARHPDRGRPVRSERSRYAHTTPSCD